MVTVSTGFAVGFRIVEQVLSAGRSGAMVEAGDHHMHMCFPFGIGTHGKVR